MLTARCDSVSDTIQRELCDLTSSQMEYLASIADNSETRSEFLQSTSGFGSIFSRYLVESGIKMNWDEIGPVSDETIINFDQLPSTCDNVTSLLDKLVVVKLNGGLGTSMGCRGPKSLIRVRDECTFLDLTVQQIAHLNTKYKCNVPLVLMNSFNTHADTDHVLRKYADCNVRVHSFMQSRYPRVYRESLKLVPTSPCLDENTEAWYPPGHGDFYRSFVNSGLLRKFIEEGREYVFLSNIDNLGATVKCSILNFLLNKSNRCEFLMEVTDKTRADVKGGTLCCHQGCLRLLEIAQVPKDYIDDFKSVKKFRIFNTNNLWINLSAIERVVNSGLLELEVIANMKRLSGGTEVIQLETAVGAAIKCFNGARGINVPRMRFLPVKKCDDLLLVMSNLYTLSDGVLSMANARQFATTPLVKLGPTHFAVVNDFLRRFASIPSIIELDHLTVSGDVTFGKNVTLRGTVIIVANHGDRIDIPDGACLENRVISGNLRILDH